jgi:hypothetical protein
MYIFANVYTYIYIGLCIWMHMFVHVCIHICINKYTCQCKYLYTGVLIFPKGCIHI